MLYNIVNILLKGGYFVSSIRKTAENTAQRLGLSFDKKRGVGYGVYRGYTMLVLPRNETSGRELTSYISIAVCASRYGQAPDSGLFEGIPFGIAHSSDGFMQMFSADVSYSRSGVEKVLVNTANAVVTALSAAGCENCNINGEEGLTDIYFFKDGYVFINEADAERMVSELDIKKSEYSEIPENMLLGIIGAAVCSLIGAAIILLLGRVGRVSLLGGLAMGGGIVWGYKKFGRKLSAAGAVICTAISVIISYLAFRTDASLDLFFAFREAEYADTFTFSLCFENTKALFELGDALDTYYMNMFLMLLCGIGGSAIVVWSERADIAGNFNFVKLGG